MKEVEDWDKDQLKQAVSEIMAFQNSAFGWTLFSDQYMKIVERINENGWKANILSDTKSMEAVLRNQGVVSVIKDVLSEGMGLPYREMLLKRKENDHGDS